MKCRKLREDLKKLGYNVTGFKAVEYPINSHFYRSLSDFFKTIDFTLFSNVLNVYKEIFDEVYSYTDGVLEKQKEIIYNSKQVFLPEVFNPKVAYEHGLIPFTFFDMNFLVFNSNKKPKNLRLDLYQLIVDKTVGSEQAFILKKPLEKYLSKWELKEANKILESIRKTKVEFYI